MKSNAAERFMPLVETIQRAHAPGALAFSEHTLQRFLAACHRRR